MAHKSDFLHINGRLVKVADGAKSQTINVCTAVNAEGHYQEVYRIRDTRAFVTATRLARNAKTLEQLDEYLMSLGATREGPR